MSYERSQRFQLPPVQLRQVAELHAASAAGAGRPVAVVCAQPTTPRRSHGRGRG